MHVTFDNGVTVQVDQRERGGRYVWVVGWCSDWAQIHDLVAAGRLERVDLGPATYGDCEFRYA